ncbi:acetate--CoA ligase family protein [Puniceibacterium sp. IMCC21224]|uniref:acetate--CoA ligase family protein n=1 Tax=Puniceibacterium sp. IMCC21224 TaxID=1618204 RepID=UPI00064DB364|nr:acetate--CoA ligase family protein [Puniceibacterium sp. IMCC21224]KMK67289.1 acyl-CoA synthetase (NDP forming) [Puniceibacterium sp. IMCC21224]
MTQRLSRLMKPRSIAVIGGGAWCRAVIQGLQSIGYAWNVWPVHPSAAMVAGVRAYGSVAELPGVPDAAFVGVNRNATIDVVAALSKRGTGGAVCFASGFKEVADGGDLNAALVAAAGDMPILGPNCYGFVNALDRASLWPDVHGLVPVTRGVAIVTQSSNIALNLTMQRRGLPIAYMVTAGNQAQTGLAQIGAALLADERVTALGMHVEGFGDLRAFETLAEQAWKLGKSIVVLKTGTSDAARATAVSHTASLAGSDAGAAALIARLGMVRVQSLDALLETLKLLHFTGPLPANQIAALACSGGESSLVSDAAARREIKFAPLSDRQLDQLGAKLGPFVTLSNPLDYHTFIWGQIDDMAQVFADMMRGAAVLTLLVVDFPRNDRGQPRGWDELISAAAEARSRVGMPLALVSSLPDTMPEEIAQNLIQKGLIPLSGLETALDAVSAVITLGQIWHQPAPVLPAVARPPPRLLDEAEAKGVLAEYGLDIPQNAVTNSAEAAAQAAANMGLVALKARGIAHKSDTGGVILNLRGADAVQTAALTMGGQAFMVEEMVPPGVELLIGVVADPAHGYVLTLGAGGVLTELWCDTQSLLLPISGADIRAALGRLRIAPRLSGYRGADPVDIAAVEHAVLAIQDYVIAQDGCVTEVEINPLIAGPNRAVAVDAIIRIAD